MQQDVGCRFRSARPLSSLLYEYFYENAIYRVGRADSSLRSSSTVQPRCYCSRADRDGDEGKRNGRGEEVARKKGGWGIGRVICTCTYCTYAEEKWAFPSEFRRFLRTHFHRARARPFNFNRLPIFPRSIPPRGDPKGHRGPARLITFYYPNNIFIGMPDRTFFTRAHNFVKYNRYRPCGNFNSSRNV